MDGKKRCKWCNLKNELYVKYHDNEWCIPNFDDKYLYEMLILESFHNYLRTFTDDRIIYEIDKTTNDLSDAISKDLQNRGMTFVGSVIIYSYLQAIGVICSHDKDCFLYKSEE